MRKKEDINEQESAEYGVDSRYGSGKERLSEGKALMEARLKRMNKLRDDQLVWARLTQFKLRIDAFLAEPDRTDNHSFTGFLKDYIDTLYSKRSIFALDMDISPVSLSQVLNNHREPNLEFLLRLMIHTEIIYRNVCPFSSDTWFKLYYQDKTGSALSTHVNISEPRESYGNLFNRKLNA